MSKSFLSRQYFALPVICCLASLPVIAQNWDTLTFKFYADYKLQLQQGNIP
jgi:hypothetical protein